jgi:hypothetical protein
MAATDDNKIRELIKALTTSDNVVPKAAEDEANKFANMMHEKYGFVSVVVLMAAENSSGTGLSKAIAGSQMAAYGVLKCAAERAS